VFVAGLFAFAVGFSCPFLPVFASRSIFCAANRVIFAFPAYVFIDLMDAILTQMPDIYKGYLKAGGVGFRFKWL